ncbi:MAG: hypothetical protein RSB55_00915 [Oscillospiraceae bacterium]
MELQLKNGDYVPDGKGGFVRSEGAEEELGRVLFLLTARRGAFSLLPELGSKLYLLPREKPARWQSLAEEYVAQALQGEEGLALQSVTVTPREDGGAEIAAKLNWKGQSLEAAVEVNP